MKKHTTVESQIKAGAGALFAGGPVIGNIERRFTMGDVVDQRTVYAQCGQCGGRTYGTAKDEGSVVACEKCGPCGSYRVGVDPAKAGSEETVLHEWRTSPTYTAAEIAGIDDDYVRKQLGLSGGAPGRYHTVVTIDGKAHSVPIAPGDSRADVDRKVRVVLQGYVAGSALESPTNDDTLALAAGGPEDVCDPQHILGAMLIGKKTGRDFYVESFSAGRYVLKHHCPLRQEDQREDHDWRSIWDHFKRPKGAGIGVAPKAAPTASGRSNPKPAPGQVWRFKSGDLFTVTATPYKTIGLVMRRNDTGADSHWIGETCMPHWEFVHHAKGAGVGVAPKRVVVLRPGQQYVSEVDRPNREKGWVCTYVGPAMTDGLHKFYLGGEVFIFSGDGWSPKSTPTTSTRAVAEATYTPQPPKQKPFTFEGCTRAGVLQFAEEMALENGLRISQQVQREEVWHIEVGDTVQHDGAAACEALLRDLMRALPPFDRASCIMALRIDHEGGAFASNRLSGEWWPLQRKLEAALSAQVPARPIAEASVAAAKERDALRRELATPPRGYSVAVWKAHCCAASEDANGRPTPLNSADVAALRGWVDDGSVPVPERLLIADRSQLLDKPLHAYRFDRRGGR